jgi:hypothetical protein
MSWKTFKDNGIAIQFPGGGGESLRVVFEPGGTDIAYVIPNAQDNGNGNAALIAAAPDLLAACIRLWDAVMDTKCSLPNEVLLSAFDCRKAVVKAVTGKDSSCQADQWSATRRREQNRLRQQRHRAAKKSCKEATDGTQAR